ncbi:response regulator [Kitasatospora sp. NPDC097691]|uniref:response regulator n=1 Tax=Kitasatospora sp. NPDC097691 TaxID=3157231 RepID=UPI003332876E
MTGRPARVRVLLADHDRRIRELRARLIALLPEDDLDVVAQTATGPQTLVTAVEYRPDVVLANLDLPGLDGIRLAEALGTLLPDCRTVLVADHSDATALRDALAAGVTGFLPKAVSAADLAPVLRAPPAGRCHVDRALLADAITAAG